MKPLPNKEYDFLLESFFQQNNQTRFSRVGKINPRQMINKPKKAFKDRFGNSGTIGLIRTTMGI